MISDFDALNFSGNNEIEMQDLKDADDQLTDDAGVSQEEHYTTATSSMNKKSQTSERYLKAIDFLEIQVQNVLAGEVTFIEPIKIILGLIDLMDLEKAVAYCFHTEM